MISFRKIASYDLHKSTENEYEFLRELGLQIVDPPTGAPKSLHLETDTVIHSTLTRAVECIEPSTSTKLIPSQELNEVLFDMNSLCGKEAWKKEGSAAVRKGFLEAFITDRLPQSRKSLFDDVRFLLSLCVQESSNGSVSVVSHSFKLKILEAYIGTEGLLETEPELLKNFLHPDQKTYGFGEGFEVDEKSLSKMI